MAEKINPKTAEPVSPTPTEVIPTPTSGVKYPPPTPTVDKKVVLRTEKQAKLDAVLERMGMEGESNENFIKRLVIFNLMVSEARGVQGKSPTFLAEQFSTCMRAPAPWTLLPIHQKRDYESYINEWMRKEKDYFDK